MAHYSAHPETVKATHLQFGFVGGLSISMALLISPLVTFVRRCVGTRWTLLMGSVVISISLFTSSYATEIWHLFLSQGLCFGWGMGFLYVTASNILPPWFSTRRSLAVGIGTSGAGIGGLLYSVVTDRIIQSLGVGWAYRILALCALAANIVSSFLIQDFDSRAHASPSELRFNPRDLGQLEVLLIFLWGFSSELGYIILLYSLPVYALSIGLTPAQGSYANALLYLGLAVGRPPMGYISDTFGRINMAGILTCLCGIFCFALWIPTQSYVPLLFFALLSGMLCGTFWCTITPILADVVGIRKLANTFAVICIGMVLPTTFAEPVAMQLVSGVESKSFLNAQIFAGSMFLTGSLSLWVLRCRKIFANNDESASITIGRRHRYWVLWLTPQFLFSRQRV